MFCRALNDLGCVLPSEETSASVAVAVAVIQGARVDEKSLHQQFESVKKRLKALYKKEPVHGFLERLPESPAALVQQNRPLALQLFNERRLPVTSPLNQLQCDAMRARMTLRVSKKKRKEGDIPHEFLGAAVFTAMSTTVPAGL